MRFDDGTVDLVADVLDFDGLRVRYVTAAGKTVGFGVLCPVKIDRWAASGTLAGGVR